MEPRREGKDIPRALESGMEHLARTDPEVADAIRHETARQGSQLELIASENFVSEAVLEAMGTLFTNKYAEGYPGRRYYGGCEYADVVENLAIARAKQLFGADHANVQPHSGAQANTAVYMSVLKPGDTMLGMNLSHGGHLTHGHPLNFSGRFYNVVAYGVRKEDERIDYDEIASLARQHKPKVIVLGASAYPRTIDFARVRAGRGRGRSASCSRTSRTSRGWSSPASIRARCPTASSSPPPPTRPCAGPAAASSCARPSGRRSSTRPSSRGCRAARSCT